MSDINDFEEIVDLWWIGGCYTMKDIVGILETSLKLHHVVLGRIIQP